MLLALSLVAAQTGPAIEVTGMAPQIAMVEQTARREGWTRLCEGRAGEETVLRFSLPAASSNDRVLEALGGRAPFVSGYRFYVAGEALPTTCDREPVETAGEPSAVLAVGTVAALTPYLEVARACGFRGAHIRDRKDDDIVVPAHRIKPEYRTLDAGEDIVPRYGAGICYVQMHRRKP